MLRPWLFVIMVLSVGCGPGYEHEVKCAPRQSLMVWLPLGSAAISVVDGNNESCTFEYSFEIEGGYTVSRCEALPGTTLGINVLDDDLVETSFDTAQCEAVRMGNVFWDLQNQFSM